MNCDQIGDTGTCNSESGSMIPAQTRIGDLWCRLMHTEPMWPAHGQYECRTCGRRFQVAWEQPSTVAPHGMAWPPETQPQAYLGAERL